MTENELIDDLWKQVEESGILDSTSPYTIEDYENNCPYCSSTHIDKNSSHSVCLTCGTLIDKVWDTSATSDWNASYGNGRNIGRCNVQTSETFYDMSMATKMRSDANVKHQYKVSQYPHRQKKLKQTFGYLDEKANQYDIPNDVIIIAKNLYKRVSEEYLTKSGNTYGLLAGCTYLGYKRNGISICIDKVASIFNVDTNIITRNYKKLSSIVQENFKPHSASDFVKYYCENLSLSFDITETIQRIAESAETYNLTKANPHNVAAGSLVWVIRTWVSEAQHNVDDYIRQLNLQKHSVENVVKELHRFRTFLTRQIPIALT